jgi:hypothetical protein
MNGRVYREQALSPLNDARSCGSIGGERASVGTGKGASLSETLESLVDGLDTMAPVEVRGLRSMSDGVLHTIQDDPANTVGEH